MKSWQILILGILIGLVASGLVLVVLAQPRGNAIEILPLPSRPPLTVHVTGAVKYPGVYTVPESSRVEQAIQAAGGFTEEASLEAVNLAAIVQDGQRIWVPKRNQYNPGYLSESPSSGIPTSIPTIIVEFPININTASMEELVQLPGIGQQKASAIIAYRQSNGAFKSIEDVQQVPGIGEGIFNQIKDLITFTNEPVGP